jgi:arylformamidase
MAATDWGKFHPGLPPDTIKSIIPVSGLYDLEPIRLTSLNEGIRMDAETAQRNSPLFMKPAAAIPVSVVVGAEETDEYHRQAREFADAWRSEANPLEPIELPGKDHFSIIEEMTEPGNLLTATILSHCAPVR